MNPETVHNAIGALAALYTEMVGDLIAERERYRKALGEKDRAIEALAKQLKETADGRRDRVAEVPPPFRAPRPGGIPAEAMGRGGRSDSAEGPAEVRAMWCDRGGRLPDGADASDRLPVCETTPSPRPSGGAESPEPSTPEAEDPEVGARGRSS